MIDAAGAARLVIEIQRKTATKTSLGTQDSWASVATRRGELLLLRGGTLEAAQKRHASVQYKIKLRLPVDVKRGDRAIINNITHDVLWLEQPPHIIPQEVHLLCRVIS